MSSRILTSLSRTSSSFTATTTTTTTFSCLSSLTSRLRLRHFNPLNNRFSAAALMDRSSSSAAAAPVDSISDDLNNQKLENNVDGVADTFNSDNRVELKLDKLKCDHSFVRELSGVPLTNSIPKEDLRSCCTKVSPSGVVDNLQLVSWSDTVAEVIDVGIKQMPYAQFYGGHQIAHAEHQRHFSSSQDLLRYSQVMTDENSKSTTRVVFCGLHFPASHIYTMEYLQSHPFIKVDAIPFEEIPRVIGIYDICVVKSMRLTSDIIAKANKMKLIMQFGVGLEGIDIDAATKHGIKVARIPSNNTGNASSCAEMAIYLMLGLLRKQHEMQVSIKERKLGDPAGDTLLGKTIFILGYGNIGIHLAKRLRPFDVKILATKRSWHSHSQNSCKTDVSSISTGTDDELVDEKGSHQDILKFASRADIVICCLAMNNETAGIVDKVFISSMRKGALLVNIARGGLLDYDAVVHYLECGHLGGLGTDVAWTEPFDPDDPVLKFPNVIMTPHVAGVTELSYRTMAKVVGDIALQHHLGSSLTGLEFVN